MILKRGALTDHYVEDERSVVMVDESVLGLSPIATTILEAVPDGRRVSLDDVTEHVVAAFGPPEGPESAKDLATQQVWDMVAHKVLVIAEGDRVDDEGSTPTAGYGVLASGHDERAVAVSALRQALRHVRSNPLGIWSAPETVSSTAFVAAARQHHVVPYLAAHLDRLDLPDRARSELEAMASRQRAGATLLAANLSVALQAMNAVGVPALALKGVALAAQAHGDYAVRGAGDLDLLVAPENLALAYQALTHAGWRPAANTPSPDASWAWRHFVRTGHELTLVGADSDIDLHWHLVPTRGTFPDFDTLWGRREVHAVDHHPVPTLSRYDALAHSAGHAAKDGWRWLRSMLDVHTLIADRDTWRNVDRPLRSDQLLSVGLACREFGTPPGAPAVVDAEARGISDALLERVRQQQADTTPEHRPLPTPGIAFLSRARAIRLTHGSLAEAGRLVSRSALPPWLTAELTTPFAVLAIPRVLARRVRHFAVKACASVQRFTGLRRS